MKVLCSTQAGAARPGSGRDYKSDQMRRRSSIGISMKTKRSGGQWKRKGEDGVLRLPPNLGGPGPCSQQGRWWVAYQVSSLNFRRLAALVYRSVCKIALAGSAAFLEYYEKSTVSVLVRVLHRVPGTAIFGYNYITSIFLKVISPPFLESSYKTFHSYPRSKCRSFEEKPRRHPNGEENTYR